MRSFASFLIIVLFAFSACKKNQTYIDIETMASIIIDSKKAEALVQTSYPDSSEQVEILKQFNEDILKKHKVTKDSYQQSLDYYKNNPKEMNKLIDCLKHKKPNTNVD